MSSHLHHSTEATCALGCALHTRCFNRLCLLQVLEAVLERLQDFEDKVRSRAIATICEAAIAHPEVSLLCFAMLVVAPLANAARLVSGVQRIPNLDAAQSSPSEHPVVPDTSDSVVDPCAG